MKEDCHDIVNDYLSKKRVNGCTKIISH